jgi:hypothetical protein
MPFFVFLIEVSWEFYLAIKAKSTNKKSLVKKSWITKEGKPERIRIPYQGPTQCLMIGFTLVFIGGYTLLGITYYLNLS